MKRHYLPLLSLLVLVATVLYVNFAWKRQSAAAKVNVSIIPRLTKSSDSAEWLSSKKAITTLQQRLQQKPNDKATLIALANYMILESRASGLYHHYDAAAMHYINQVLYNEASNFEALCLKGLVQLSQHHFYEALATAETAQRINPFSAFVYGILTDAFTQIGEYEKAVNAAEKMMEIKPDQRCYARVSYLRELYGDFAGAKEVMQAAVEAGVDGQEDTEWCRVQLGNLYVQTGQLDSAAKHFNLSLLLRPGFAPAYAGLGDVAQSRKDYAAAFKHFTEAADASGQHQYADKIAQTASLMGKQVLAGNIYEKLIQEMEATAKEALSDETKGHYTDKEIAEVLLMRNDYKKALHYAQLAYNRQPGNIEVNESLAWCHYKNKNYQMAQQYIDAALRTNSQHSRLLCRAGLIYLQKPNIAKAKQLLTQGLKQPTPLLEGLKTESKAALAGL
jgi:tetratricopeptide (TPR) repeat protein